MVRTKEDIVSLDALVLPGGESSTIARNMRQTGLFNALQNRIEDNDIAIMGTCAGCVLLASSLTSQKKEISLLNAMDIQVQRNAFGRQCQSFECQLKFNGFTSNFPAVFIRAPVITKVGNNIEILSTIDKKIVAARKDRFLALSFHPELTKDDRIHSFFIDLI